MRNAQLTHAGKALEDLSADPLALDLARRRAELEATDREERAREVAEARAETMRQAVLSIVRVLGLVLTPEREAGIASMELEGLERLHTALVRDRAWPS